MILGFFENPSHTDLFCLSFDAGPNLKWSMYFQNISAPPRVFRILCSIHVALCTKRTFANTVLTFQDTGTTMMIFFGRLRRLRGFPPPSISPAHLPGFSSPFDFKHEMTKRLKEFPGFFGSSPLSPGEPSEPIKKSSLLRFLFILKLSENH